MFPLINWSCKFNWNDNELATRNWDGRSIIKSLLFKMSFSFRSYLMIFGVSISSGYSSILFSLFLASFCMTLKGLTQVLIPMYLVRQSMSRQRRGHVTFCVSNIL